MLSGMADTADRVSFGTAATLCAAAGLHVAWSRGSSFPFASTAEMTDAVVGSTVPPSRTACLLVATLLGLLGLLVALGPRAALGRRLLHGAAVALAARAVVGFAGRTDLLVKGSVSPSFRRNDRRIFAPLCALLSCGVLVSSSRRR